MRSPYVGHEDLNATLLRIGLFFFSIASSYRAEEWKSFEINPYKAYRLWINFSLLKAERARVAVLMVNEYHQPRPCCRLHQCCLVRFFYRLMVNCYSWGTRSVRTSHWSNHFGYVIDIDDAHWRIPLRIETSARIARSRHQWPCFENVSQLRSRICFCSRGRCRFSGKKTSSIHANPA